MLPLNLAQADPKNAPNTSNTQANKKAVWKRMFGAKGSGGGKNNSSKNATIPKSESSTNNNNNIKPLKQKKTKSSSKKPKRDEFEEMLNRGCLTLPEDDNNRSQRNLQENGHLDIQDFSTPAPNITKRDVDVDAVSQEGSMRTTTTTAAASTAAGNGASVSGEKGGGQSFMGVGKDGMWISRKNFLRT